MSAGASRLLLVLPGQRGFIVSLDGLKYGPDTDSLALNEPFFRPHWSRNCHASVFTYTRREPFSIIYQDHYLCIYFVRVC